MSEPTDPAPPPPPPPKKNNYAWIGYFAFLIVASVGVVAVTIEFNRRMQLTREKLEAAEKLWQENGPKSYKVVFTKQIREDKPITFAVTVRDKKVTEVLMDGAALKKNPEQTDDPRIYHSMDAQFLYMRRFMDLDAKPQAPRAYVVGRFDPQTGAVLYFVRYVKDNGERVQLTFQPVEPLKD